MSMIFVSPDGIVQNITKLLHHLLGQSIVFCHTKIVGKFNVGGL